MIANTTEVANRARRRVALRLLPYLAILYIIAFLDRTNISTAALQMPQELGFDDRVLGLGSGIFFAGYFLLEIPGAVIVEKWGARRWLSRIMVTWGIVSVGMAFIHTAHQFYTLRFLLGLAEAGFFPWRSRVSHALVYSLGPLKIRRSIHGRDPALVHYRLTDIRLAARRSLVWRKWLALAFHSRRFARSHLRNRHVVLSNGLAAPSSVATR